MSNPRVIFASYLLPSQGISGSQNVNRAILQYLAASGIKVHYCCLNRFGFDRIGMDFKESWPWTFSLTGYHEKESGVFKRSLAFRFWDIVHRVFQKTINTLKLKRFIDPASPFAGFFNRSAMKTFSAAPDGFDKRHVEACVGKISPACVIIDYAHQSALFQSLGGTSCLKVILTHDLIHRRVEALKKNNLPVDVPDWSAEQEAAHLAAADVLLVEREDELAAFKELAPKATIIVTPLAVTAKTATKPKVKGRCLFVGSSSPHNQHGLQWFLREVWPDVLKTCKDVSLVVCGDVCNTIPPEEKLAATPRVTWLGRVADLEQEYDDAEICIIPLLTGSGFKTKLIEALSHGMPVVSTPAGATGLPRSGLSPVLMAGDAEEFAAQLNRVLSDADLRQEMSRRALAYVTGNLTPEILYSPLARLIKENAQEHAVNRQSAGSP